MIVTIGGIPVYDAIISDQETGMFKISLVDDPAVMSLFQAFDANKKPMLYAIQDEEKRLVRGCIMRADFPIYRRDNSLGEYYVIYKADTIREMAEKYLLEGRQNDINIMHQDGSDVDGVQMVQYFIKGDGIQVDGFDDCADGSLFGEFHVVNDDVWAEIKAGTYKGFSLEGVFDLIPEKDADEVQSIVDVLDGAFKKLFKHKKNMSKLSRLKETLAKMLQEFGNVTTDKGVLSWDGDDDLKAGDSVFVEDAEGNRTPAEDGDYKTDDNKVIVVSEGKVAEIKDAEAEVASTEENFAEVSTDKGTLIYEGEEDLKAGDAVYVKDENGENVTAPDGDYKTTDGKVIKVADGKVTEIVDDAAEVAFQDLKAKAVAKFAKIRQAYSESYNEKESKMNDAIHAAYPDDYPWIFDAGDDYCVAEIWDDASESYKMFRFPVTWNEDGTCTLGEKEEVKWQIVPADAKSAWDAPSEEEFNALVTERDSLKEQVTKLSRMSAAKPAHEEVKESVEMSKTGNRRLDRLSRILGAK